MRLDLEHDVQVARGPASHAGLPLTAEPDLRTGVHAGRDLHREPPARVRATLAAALRARVLENASRAATRRAGRGRDHLAEDRLRGAPDLARAPASGTRVLAAARLGAAPGAAFARGQPWHLELLLEAGEGLFERDRQVVAEVISAVGALPARARAEPAAEERVEDVRERHVGEVDRGTAGAGGRV